MQNTIMYMARMLHASITHQLYAQALNYPFSIWALFGLYGGRIKSLKSCFIFYA